MQQTRKKQITVYKPNQRHELGFFNTWLVMAGNVLNSRELVWQLFKRDFLAGYKKSFIGFTWIFISPIMGIVSWVFLKQTGMLNPGDVGIPYPVYVLIGSSMWGLFMGFFNSSKQTLTAGVGFIMQVNYPHEALLFKQVAQTLANFSISFGMNLIILFAFKVLPSWKIIFLPLVIFPMFCLGAAVGLIVSMVSVVAFDVDKAVQMLMGLFIYTTPIIYSDQIPNAFVQMIIKWNPLTYLVCSARDIMLYGRLYHLPGFAICALGSVLLFFVAWRLFYVSEHSLVERMI